MNMQTQSQLNCCTPRQRHPDHIGGVPLEPQAHEQLRNIASIPFVGPWVAVMPDVHGEGATVGSVIPTRGAIIPAAVGVDIGCGMAAVRTSLRASDLPDDLGPLRSLDRAQRAGRATAAAARATAARGIETCVAQSGWSRGWTPISRNTARSAPTRLDRQIGTLGGGNHFIELLPRRERCGVGDAAQRLARRRQPIGSTSSSCARAGERAGFHLPDKDLAYLRRRASELVRRLRGGGVVGAGLRARTARR